jgi:hypothetical protein
VFAVVVDVWGLFKNNSISDFPQGHIMRMRIQTVELKLKTAFSPDGPGE